MTKRLIISIRILSALIVMAIIATSGEIYLGWSGFEAYVAGLFCGYFIYDMAGQLCYAFLEKESK